MDNKGRLVDRLDFLGSIAGTEHRHEMTLHRLGIEVSVAHSFLPMLSVALRGI